VAVLSRADAVAFANRARAAGKRIVFTNGVFDLLHIGHVRYLKQSRALGDVLIVGVNADSSVRRLGKGPERPVTRESDRAGIIAALAAVDAVVVFEEDTPEETIKALLPDILVKGADWQGKENPGQAFIEARGGKMVFIPLESGYSTTGILKSLRTS